MRGLIISPEWMVVSSNTPPRKLKALRVLGTIIDEISDANSLINKYPEDEVIHAEDQILAPGFVNSHTHLYGVLAHGIPLTKAPEGFWPFLNEFWWPIVEDRIDDKMLGAACAWQCRKMLQSGVTSFYDCLEAPNAIPNALDLEAEVISAYGQRAILSFEATERISLQNGELGLMENKKFIQSSRARKDLISGMMCYHTTFTCSEQFILRAFELAHEENSLVHAHCSEGTYEPEQMLKRNGLRTLQYYEELGVAGEDFLTSQCVQLSPEEIGILAAHGMRVAHMPLSNCEVGGGIAPIPKMAAAGITLGLGSDSYIDNFFEVMRGAFLIHKAAQIDPRVMPASLVWHMATEGGAIALGLKKVGRLEPGWQADMQLIRADLPTPPEPWNLLDQLILYRNPGDIRLVMTAGKILLKDGQVLIGDEEEARQALHTQTHRLWKKAM